MLLKLECVTVINMTPEILATRLKDSQTFSVGTHQSFWIWDFYNAVWGDLPQFTEMTSGLNKINCYKYPWTTTSLECVTVNNMTLIKLEYVTLFPWNV